MHDINDLRELLFATIEAVKNGKMDIEKAKMISELSQVMVNSAKLDIDMVRVGGGRSSFVPVETEEKKKDKRPDAIYSNSTPFKIANS